MDWFERLTGFPEAGYEQTRGHLEVRADRLYSKANGGSWRIGTLALPSLAELRSRVDAAGGLPGKLKVGIVCGDVRAMHHAPEYAGALFQVASQFNLLEMTSPRVMPEQGVTRYEQDLTQGPACAIAAGAATIYRNYFVPMGEGQQGQTAARQLNGLAGLGAALAAETGISIDALWTMRNGYALPSRTGLAAIARHLSAQPPEQIDMLRSKLRVGLHGDVEVTDRQVLPPLLTPPLVSQVFCSALPVSYAGINLADPDWTAFASLVLEAAYEATLWAAVLNAQRGASKIVLLTRLGGGAFGNQPGWIHAALRRALTLARGCEIEVRIVCFKPPPAELLQLVDDFA